MRDRGYLWLPVIAALSIGWLWVYADMNQPQGLTLTASSSYSGTTLIVPKGTVPPGDELVIVDEISGSYLANCSSTPCQATVPVGDPDTVVAIVETTFDNVIQKSKPIDLASLGTH